MTWTGESLIKSNSQFFDRQDCNRSSISPHICRKASKSYAIYPWKSGSSSAVPWRTSFGLIRDSCQFSLLASQLYSAIYKPRKSTPCFSIYTHYLIISLLFLSLPLQFSCKTESYLMDRRLFLFRHLSRPLIPPMPSTPHLYCHIKVRIPSSFTF